MKTTLDNFNTTTLWTASGGASIYGLNEIKEFVAGELSASLILKFSGLNSYCEKVYTTAVSTVGYDYLTFSIWSQKLGSTDYRTTDDFVYKIDLGSGKEYYLPVYSVMSEFTLDISDITSIERIRITALHSETDYLVISYGVISTDDMPLDVFVGFKEQYDRYFAAHTATKFLVGTIQECHVGDTNITFIADPIWIDRYSQIYISDGAKSEYHHVDQKDGRTIGFDCLVSGKELLYDHAEGTSVYLYIPCNYGPYEREIILPSVNIWGLVAENVQIETDVQEDYDTWKTDGTVNWFLTGRWYKYNIIIDCESHSVELLAEASTIVRKLLGRETIWVNGRAFRIQQVGLPAEIEPTEVIANIPKIQYTCELEVKEDIWDKVRLPKTDLITNTYNIEQGVL